MNMIDYKHEGTKTQRHEENNNKNLIFLPTTLVANEIPHPSNLIPLFLLIYVRHVKHFNKVIRLGFIRNLLLLREFCCLNKVKIRFCYLDEIKINQITLKSQFRRN